MKRICIPLEIKVKVSNKKLKWAFTSKENFQYFTNALTDIRLEQKKIISLLSSFLLFMEVIQWIIYLKKNRRA